MFEKNIWHPGSEFAKELERYKLKAEIKPRKVNIMQAQDEFAETSMAVEKHIRIVNAWEGRK